MKRQLLCFLTLLLSIVSYTQVTISGVVYDEYLEPIYNAKISCAGENFSPDVEGNFKFTIKDVSYPQKITVTSVGFMQEVVEITEETDTNIILKKVQMMEQVVISASRVPEKIIESPVTVERLGLTDIRKMTSNSFYDNLVNLKGVNIREASYGYKSINTRGFADFNNTRFVQLVDGLDASVPALNHNLGSLTGLNNLDIESVEILPGASSALYGANAYNGIMIVKSKNPFEYEGISAIFKSGVNNQEELGSNQFYNVTVRAAHQFNDYFAAKINFSFDKAKEWIATDYRAKNLSTANIIGGATDNTLTAYNGVNIYGDEYVIYNLVDQVGNFGGYTISPEHLFLVNGGYTERQLIKKDAARNIKFSGSFNFRPIKNNPFEIILGTNLALIDNIYQGENRLAQRDSYFGQHKLELKGENFFVRGYYTSNVFDNVYDLTETANAIVSNAKENAKENSIYTSDWAGDFIEQLYGQGNTIKDSRNLADSKYGYLSKTNSFNKAFLNASTTLISEGGGAYYDNSNYIHTDANYNFKDLIKWADIQVGGSYRKYKTDSKGTFFNDQMRSIKINEYGAYTQIQKKTLEERLKITASIRYDKSTNFDGSLSPRLAINYGLGADKNHILRVSYQTGFRNPTIREQYINSVSGGIRTIGATKANLENLNFVDSNYKNDTRVFTQDTILRNSVLAKYLLNEAGNIERNISKTKFVKLKSEYTKLNPEIVKSFEFGYRSLFPLNNNSNVDIDISAFYSTHNDFVFQQEVVTPNVGNFFPTYDYENNQYTNKVGKSYKETIDFYEAILADPDTYSAYFGPDFVNAVSTPGFVDNFKNYVIRDGIQVLDMDLYRSIFGSVDNHFQRIRLVTNAQSVVHSYGANIGIHTKIFKQYNFGINYNYTDFEYEDKDNGTFEPNFNTPKHTVKISLGNDRLFKNFGFRIDTRWSDTFKWVSPFVTGNVDARTVVDTQFTYTIPSLKSRFKIVGTNLLGKEYFSAPGTAKIGSTYFVSWIIND